MSSIAEKIIKPKLGVLELAKELESVSQACKVIGYSSASLLNSQTKTLQLLIQ